MDPKVSKGILAISAAVNAFLAIWFADDPLMREAFGGLGLLVLGWLFKTPGDMRMRPIIERDAP